MYAAAAAKSLQLCLILCDPIDGSPPVSAIDGSPPGSPVPGILRQEHWSGLPFPSPMPESESEVAQSCPTLSDPMDCSPPGSSVHGVFQARVLEWVPLVMHLIFLYLLQLTQERYLLNTTQFKLRSICLGQYPLVLWQMGFPGDSDIKESACNAGGLSSTLRSGRSLEKGTAAHSSILPGESHGLRLLEPYGPWKESDVTNTFIFSLSLQ